MKKLYLLAIAAIAFSKGHSQELHVKTGVNFTKYNFHNGNSPSVTKFQAGSGTAYEIGFVKFLNSKKDLHYTVDATLDEYNAVAGGNENSYSWNTRYAGLQGTMGYAFVKANRFQLGLDFGLNVSGIVYGKQQMNGNYYDLMYQEEFSKLIFTPFGGLQTSYKVNNFTRLSLGYRFKSSFTPFADNSEQSVTFETNQILFGLRFNN